MADLPPLGPPGRTLRRVILFGRYSNALSAAIAREQTTAFRKLEALLIAQDPTAVSPGRQAARLQSLYTKADQVLVETYRTINQGVRKELTKLAAASADAQQQELATLGQEGVLDLGRLTLPTRDQMAAIVTTDPVQGATMSDWWGRQTRAARDGFRTEIQLGLSRREALPDLIRRVRGRVLRGGERPTLSGGLYERSTRAATALVRTAVNQVSNNAALLTMQRNSDLVQAVEFVATLDERTTAICASLDGTVWAIDDPTIQRPPLHYNAVHAGELVRTATGDRPIEAVRVGDLVWTHAGRWRPVTAVMGKRPDHAEGRELQTSRGTRVRVTNEHPILTGRGWRRADQVEAGDQLFEAVEEGAEVSDGEGVPVEQAVLLDAHHRPSLLDEPAVAWEVAVTTTGVSAAIQFQRDALRQEGEIDDVPPDGMLEVDLFGEEGPEEELAGLGGGAVPVRAAHGRLRRRSLVEDGVRGRAHATAMPCGQAPGGCGALGAPVIGTAGARMAADGAPLPLGTHRDPVAPARGVEGGLAEPEGALDGAQGFPLPEMPLPDQLRHRITIAQVHPRLRWVRSTVIVARAARNTPRVYNLAVAEDESFLVAGVVAHNCRSVLVPRLDYAAVGLQAPSGPDRQTYPEWFAQQPAGVQDRILGPGRAALFRQGAVGFGDLVRSDGSQLSLDDLKAKLDT